MNTDGLGAAFGGPERLPSGNCLARAMAMMEVVLAFAFVHVAFRAFKHFTELGRLEGKAHLNFTPGVVMILFTVGVLLACRRSFAAYGLTATRRREGLKAGLLWGMVLVQVPVLISGP